MKEANEFMCSCIKYMRTYKLKSVLFPYKMVRDFILKVKVVESSKLKIYSSSFKTINLVCFYATTNSQHFDNKFRTTVVGLSVFFGPFAIPMKVLGIS